MTANPTTGKRVVPVDRAQILAARGLLELAERGTGNASPAIYAIAHAKPVQRLGLLGSVGSNGSR